MRVLAIECASPACSVALFDGDALITGAYELIGRGHAERLVPLIADLPERGRAGAICVSLGPGSFTGLRIGIAAARALGLAWKVRVTGYPTLALVAAMARERRGEQVAVSVAMEGGHGQWFVANFSACGSTQVPAMSLSPGDAVRAAVHPLVAGNAAKALVKLRGSGAALDLLPDARCVDLLPGSIFSHDLAPLYGRAPDAAPSIPGIAADALADPGGLR